MWVTGILLATIGLILTKWMWERRRKLKVFESLGIPGPKPNFVDGNKSRLTEEGLHPWMEQGCQKYGKVWGYYEATTPVIVISDLDMIKQILVKDFSNFNARKMTSLMQMQDQYVNVFDAEGSRWKRLRTISAPHFSAKSMKQMSPLINTVLDKLMSLMEKLSSSGKPFNIHEEFQKLTLDVITSTAFGIETDTISQGGSVWLDKVRFIFSPNVAKSRPLYRKLMFALFLNAPGFKQITSKFMTALMIKYLKWYYDAAKKIVLERRKNPSERRDFITLMLEANELNPNVSESNLTVNLEREEEGVGAPVNRTAEGEKILKGLTMEEIQAQSFIFLAAGYETTSTALGFLAYELARNPEVQEKLQAEVDQHFPDKCRPDYTSVSKLQYMDMVINENLRLHNIAAIATTRVCKSTCRVGDFTIPEGMVVQLDSNQVLLDPEHWGPEDPNEFVPERFLPERKANRHPMAFLAFGGGPRNCVGMRFALMEIKITIARVLMLYTIKECDRTQHPLPLSKTNVRGPSEGVYVTLVRRES